MSVRDVPAQSWPDFLDHFGAEHRAWLATVDRREIEGQDASPQLEAVDRPLISVVPETRAQRVVSVDIRFREDAKIGQVHIERPVRVRVDETPEGVASGLEIDDAEGYRTRIRFRAAPLPEMLDGVAPGELPSP
jgi:hypothetical protein